MIEKNSLNSKGEGLFKMSDEEIYELLKQTGCLYGKIISSSEFEEWPLKPIFVEVNKTIPIKD